VRILFTAAIFVGSCLLFLVQPMAARIVLPAFGGTPAVWSASMVFFQAALLLGYLYAHLTNRHLGPKRQAPVHLAVVVLAGLTLPFAIRVGSGAEGQGNPALALIGQLALLVGAAFFAVSAGSPALQRWFASTSDPAAKDPYFLYSASNVGSMAALLAYPFVVEPQLDLRDQSRLWFAGYVLMAILLAACAALVWRSERRPDADQPSPPAPSEGFETITWRRRGFWIALSAVPSSLLLGVTNYITSNVAPMPLLWVIPLALYLATFIFAFASRRLVSTAILGRVMPLIVTPLAVAIVLRATEPLLLMLGLHLLAFFVCAWMCHARLSDARPRAEHLTEFYLWMSVGGVLGGIFNALLAPNLFNDYLEYPLALVGVGLLRPAIAKDGGSLSKLDLGYSVAVAGIAGAVAIVASNMKLDPGPLRTGLVIGLPAILAFLAVDRPLRYGLSLGGMFFVAYALQVTADGDVVKVVRSFFGVHRVVFKDGGRFHRLIHGTTLHGQQDMENPGVPLTYYHPTGPIGRIMRKVPLDRQREVALVGLGVGSLAAYGKPGQKMTYFEIDPDVEAIARDPRLFTFMRDSKANVNVILGDARLTLRQRPDESYGIIALDAFSSDAIPIHLLTREAFAMYLRKLRPGGLIAVHISNRYLDLAPVLAANAYDLGLQAWDLQDAVTSEEDQSGKQPSHWVMLARTEADAKSVLHRDFEWSKLERRPDFRTWTDDYSNVLAVYTNEN
jgi:SAM-dependent methyltransferase